MLRLSCLSSVFGHERIFTVASDVRLIVDRESLQRPYTVQGRVDRKLCSLKRVIYRISLLQHLQRMHDYTAGFYRAFTRTYHHNDKLQISVERKSEITSSRGQLSTTSVFVEVTCDYSSSVKARLPPFEGWLCILCVRGRILGQLEYFARCRARKLFLRRARALNNEPR